MLPPTQIVVDVAVAVTVGAGTTTIATLNVAGHPPLVRVYT